jgi:hypothetical protein
MLKNRFATPIFENHLNKIKGFRAFFLKVRKTGKKCGLGSTPKLFATTVGYH